MNIPEGILNVYAHSKHVGEKVIRVQSFILLAIVYVLLGPILSLLVKQRDNKSTKGSWIPWMYPVDSIDDLRLQ